MESRGNADLVNASGVNIGSKLVSSTLHWGPAWNINMYAVVIFPKGLSTITPFVHKKWTPMESPINFNCPSKYQFRHDTSLIEA
jgi:hypothetical protein